MDNQNEIKAIKEIQNFINEKGLNNLPIFKSVMQFVPDDYQAQYDYFKNLEGKAFKHIATSTTLLRGEESTVSWVRINKVEFKNGKPMVNVTSAQMLPHYNNVIYNIDEDHELCVLTIGRYDKWTEVTPEAFDWVIKTIKDKIEEAKKFIDDVKG